MLKYTKQIVLCT